MNFFHKCILLRAKIPSLLRALLPSLWFNFKYLPLRQAIRLPILVYKPHFLRLKGSVVIDSPCIHLGMIRLGFFTADVYPNAGITLRIEGKIIFQGRCFIGNDCYVICGKDGEIVFGNDFKATGGIRLVSQHGIHFGNHVLVGWGNTIIDTNFHPLYDMEKEHFKKAFGPINIGENNWFAMNCLVMPGVTTPVHCIFAARTIVTRGGQYESYCVHGGSPVGVLSRNVMRIIGQDAIKDYTDKNYSFV